VQVPREDPSYSLFLSLGNDKLPTFAGIGHVNMYMCQFPFDLDRPPRPGTTKALSTYDYVLLNSEYTDRWYNHYTGPHIVNALRVWNAAPSVVVLHPPVEVRHWRLATFNAPPPVGAAMPLQHPAACHAPPQAADALAACPCRRLQPFPAKSQRKKPGDSEGLDADATQPQRKHIVLLGRFFRGRQSKVGLRCGGCVSCAVLAATPHPAPTCAPLPPAS
jgi:hypothetical protein